MNKTVQSLNKRKIPIVKIDNSLSEYAAKPIFQKKLDKANKILKTVGLPKQLQNN